MEPSSRRVVGLCLAALGVLFSQWRRTAGDADRTGYMDCGEGVALCGVLALQTGLGKGIYRSSVPILHGLWPQTSGYGTSACVRPRVHDPPDDVYACYQQPGRSRSELLKFQAHEFTKHGKCAGVSNAHEYFSQACKLAAAPLGVISAARSTGASLDDIAAALSASRYPLWKVVRATAEVHLSACASASGAWRIARRDEFASVCGGSEPAPRANVQLEQTTASTPPAGGDAGSCVRGRHGPRCNGDEQCKGQPGCLRCARSGFCTDVPR